MIKIISIATALCIMTASYAYAGRAEVDAWADVYRFCNEEAPFFMDEADCIDLILEYQDATREYYESLSASELRRMSDQINKLADRDSQRSKTLRKAVDDIGDTLRKPIEVPKGVRKLPNSRDQYIQQRQMQQLILPQRQHSIQ